MGHPQTEFSARIAARICKAITDSGLSQAEVARRAGLSTSTFSRRLSGEWTPFNTDEIAAVATVLDYDDPEVMLTRSEWAAQEAS
ncbi:helix-turn-helix domain-containing protein [Nocardia nova SH22a]|uniref:Helix-turn-helix domain-containing protein n=1 Tax=Nocardia nova SH22a TaxID=1415166 RepID=W5TNB7_9NOCA|nr:helix-turn-helix transcriptional regulator [Nocardia nova]AHH20752.1 helix-turn-helix domain-containing protein [Nocardia nova SH22a]